MTTIILLFRRPRRKEEGGKDVPKMMNNFFAFDIGKVKKFQINTYKGSGAIVIFARGDI